MQQKNGKTLNKTKILKKNFMDILKDNQKKLQVKMIFRYGCKNDISREKLILF